MTDAAVEMAGGDALRSLCLADPVFRDRYDGWHVIGRGVRATVVRTRSRDLGHDIALKVFVNLERELLDRIREEVRAVQALATPYLVHTYSLFDRGPIAWFEMELVDGPNLQQELDRLAVTGDRLPLVLSHEIGLSISRCVWHAHRNGVLHRDIKPANVLLPPGARPAAKLTDFGLARLADAVTSTTPAGSIMGTPRFASPEALAGERVGPPHDVYSLGATLYALFTSGPPYPVAGDASLARLRRLQRTAEPVPIQHFVPEVDPGLAREILRALHPQAGRRPDPGHIVQAIERAQARLLAPRGTSDATERVGGWRVLLAGLGLAAFGLWQRLRKERSGSSRPET